jgi:AraC-like DNA-binding protein/mannose-6-phosphate isomerase-like protein (cupin superfamily)
MSIFRKQAVAWIDDYFISASRKVYTQKQLGIPGLIMIGWHSSSKAIEPLVYHFHRGSIEITFVVKGNITFSTREEVYPLYGGDIFLMPADISHDTENNPVGICEIYWVQINVEQEPFLFLAPEWAAALRQALKQLPITVIRDNSISRKYLSTMMGLLVSNLEVAKHQGLSQLVNSLYGVIRPSMASSHTGEKAEDIQGVIKWIHDHLCDNLTLDGNLTLEKLADQAGLSLSHFKRKFYDQTGMSPRMFINTQKIEYAKKLLDAGRPITEVAFDVGFNSSNYFSTVFRKYTFSSPKEYVATHS